MDLAQAFILSLSLWVVGTSDRTYTLGITYPPGVYLKVEGERELSPPLPLLLYGGVYLRSFTPHVSGRVGVVLGPCTVGGGMDYPGVQSRVFLECSLR